MCKIPFRCGIVNAKPELKDYRLGGLGTGDGAVLNGKVGKREKLGFHL